MLGKPVHGNFGCGNPHSMATIQKLQWVACTRQTGVLHDHLGPGPAHRAKGTGCASVSMGVPEDAPGHWLQESMLRVFVARVVVATHQYLIV